MNLKIHLLFSNIVFLTLFILSTCISPFLLCPVIFLPTLSSYTVIASVTQSTLSGNCYPDLDNKFLSAKGKCPFVGYVAVKGSCTEYIPCINLGGDRPKPLKRAICPESVGFDIEILRCSTGSDLNNCLQKVCYSKVRSNQNQYGHSKELQPPPDEIIERIFEEASTTNSSFSTSRADITIHGSGSQNELESNETESIMVSTSSKLTASFIPFYILIISGPNNLVYK